MQRKQVAAGIQESGLSQPKVSDWSEFESPIWRTAEPMAGQRSSHGSLNWDMSIRNDASLLDDEFRSLRWHLRVFVWTLIHDPRGAKSLSPGGLAHLRETLKSAARWMAAEGMSDFSRLSNAASWRYLD